MCGGIMYAWLMNFFSRIFGNTAKMNMEKGKDETTIDSLSDGKIPRR